MLLLLTCDSLLNHLESIDSWFSNFGNFGIYGTFGNPAESQLVQSGQAGGGADFCLLTPAFGLIKGRHLLRTAPTSFGSQDLLFCCHLGIEDAGLLVGIDNAVNHCGG